MATRKTETVPVLLERERELGQVDAAIQRARRGVGGTLAVEGPAGIGKTVLLQVAAHRAESEELRVLRACGRELERDFPFGVARQLFETPLRDRPPAERAQLLAGAAAPAAGLLGPVPSDRQPADAAFALTHALYWLTANLAERHALLVTVDDVHWADRESIQALAYLAARIEELPVLLVIATRTGDGDADGLLRRAVKTVRPAPLGPAGTAAVVRAAAGGAGVSDALCEACHRATGGNPFLARELALAAAEEGISGDGPDAARLAELAPETASRATLPRIRRLGAGAHALVRAVAVLDRAPLRYVAALAGLEERAAGEAAERLAGAGILADELPLRFHHPILRAIVLDDLSPTSRERLHRRAAELLAREGEESETIASHLALTEPQGHAWAAEILHDAGRRALANGAPEAAARALRRAIAERADQDRAPLLHDLGRAEALSGDRAAAERLAEAYAAAEDPVTRASILATLGETRFVAGELAAAVDAFRRGLDELDGSADTALELQMFLGYTMLGRAYQPSARDAHDRIAERAPANDPRSGLAETARLAALAYDGFLSGADAPQVRAQAAAALAGAGLLDAGGPAAQAFHLTSWALAGADGFEQAEEALEVAFREAARSGSFLAFAVACHHRLWSLWRRGQVLQALADTEIALELAARGWHLVGPAAGWARVECLLETGDVAAATEALEDTERLAPGLAGSCVESWPLMGRSRVELEHGDPAAALDAALRCGAQLTALHAANPAVAAWRSRAALAAAAIGDRPLARALWEEELHLARRFGAPRATGIALRAAGVIEGGTGGVALLREAVTVLDASPAVLERARALTDLGAALRRDRQVREAREPLRRGLELARSCGAAALAVRARDELVAAGARPRRDAVRGPAALTPRELRIAELAVEGAGNREIAQTLFITRKTVEAHMRSIFRKLDVSARGGLADALRGEGPR